MTRLRPEMGQTGTLNVFNYDFTIKIAVRNIDGPAKVAETIKFGFWILS
jgi:hypothetical protein